MDLAPLQRRAFFFISAKQQRVNGKFRILFILSSRLFSSAQTLLYIRRARRYSEKRRGCEAQRSTIGRGYAIADGAYLRYMGQGQARFTLCHDSRRAATRERANVLLRRKTLLYFHVHRTRWKDASETSLSRSKRRPQSRIH